jgi:hypothetical protein
MITLSFLEYLSLEQSNAVHLLHLEVVCFELNIFSCSCERLKGMSEMRKV